MKVSIIVPVYNVEKYLRETLESIQVQTLADYEVLVVDDGSTDGSLAVAEAFCAGDWRFFVYRKENSGVSDTRNFALDRAKGEYVFFVDGDDIIPPTALESLYRCAKERDADMVVGMMQEFGIYGLRPIRATAELAAKKRIDRYDVRLPWIFSVCNKLFRRSVIEEHHIRFEKMRYTEDGLFSFQYTFCCRSITGCEEMVYHYRKRSFWEENSVTQAATEGYLKDLLMALGRIIELSEGQREVAEREALARTDDEYPYLEYAKSHMALYMAELYRKFIRVNLLQGFYRRLWKSDDGMLGLLKKSILEYKRHLFPGMWDDLITAEPDLRLEEGILTKEELAMRPLITIAVSDRVPGEYLNRLIASIYCQSFPAFIVYVHAKHAERIDENYRRKINLTVLEEDMDTAAFKNRILGLAKSPYLAFIDEPIYLGFNTYEKFYRWMADVGELDFVTCRLKLVDEEGETQDLHIHDVCTLSAALPKRKMAYTAIDWPMGNKLFCTQALRGRKFSFTNDPAADMALLYKKLRYNALDKTFMTLELSEKEFRSRIRNPRLLVGWRFLYQKLLSRTEPGNLRRDMEHQKWLWDTKKQIMARLPVRKEVLFVCDSGDRLGANAQAVYDAYDGKKYIWAHRGPYAQKDLLRLYWHLFTCKVIVADDTFRYFKSFRLKEEQKILQLWHTGGALEKFGLDGRGAQIGDRGYHDQYDTVAVSAEGVRDSYVHAFGIHPQKIRPLGVPETDKWLDASYVRGKREEFFRAYPQFEGKKLLLYMPSCRESAGRKVSVSPKLDWERLDAALGADCVLLIKNHPSAKKELTKGKEYRNIAELPKEDTCRLLAACDVFITDFDPLLFHAALLKKPLVLWYPDCGTDGREFYADYPRDLYGEAAGDQEQLAAACRRALDSPDLSALAPFLERFMGGCDGRSTERIVNLIREKLNS